MWFFPSPLYLQQVLGYGPDSDPGPRPSCRTRARGSPRRPRRSRGRASSAADRRGRADDRKRDGRSSRSGPVRAGRSSKPGVSLAPSSPGAASSPSAGLGLDARFPRPSPAVQGVSAATLAGRPLSGLLKHGGALLGGALGLAVLTTIAQNPLLTNALASGEPLICRPLTGRLLRRRFLVRPRWIRPSFGINHGPALCLLRQPRAAGTGLEEHASARNRGHPKSSSP